MKNTVKIANLNIENRIFTAPMAGITDRAQREILHEMGPGLVTTEMISDMALLYNNKKTLQMVDIKNEPKPLAIQLCGNDPKTMALAAEKVTDLGADIIDINMGCPAPKVIKNGEGCALMQDENRAVAIVKEIFNAVSNRVPVTVKMRKGWDDDNLNGIELAKKVAAVGADAITIHGRTRKQFYSGNADWQYIKDLVAALDIPVIGNGDIFTVADGKNLLQETKCNAIMVGRGMLGNPWLIKDLVSWDKNLLENKTINNPNLDEVFAMAKKHLLRSIEIYGEYIGIRTMRKQLAWYIKGLRYSASYREKINRADDLELLLDILEEYKLELKAS